MNVTCSRYMLFFNNNWQTLSRRNFKGLNETKLIRRSIASAATDKRDIHWLFRSQKVQRRRPKYLQVDANNNNRAMFCRSKGDNAPFTMTIDTPQFRALFTPELEQLISIFKRYGFELRLAGGAVRDLLMHKQPHDLDFATTATPNEMKDMFGKEEIRMINNKGEKHGTITARINDKENFEVTTLRIDVKTDGRHAEVEFTTDWEVDANRRDLTINSMFLGLDGTLYDYFNGREDLKQRRVMFVGDAAQRIQEDYLRILRYFRFYGRIAVEPTAHDQEILEVLRKNMHGLAGISGERMWVELKKILLGPHNYSLLATMLELNVGPYIGLPVHPNTKELEKMWLRSQELKPQAITLIASLLRHEQEMIELHSRLKLSAFERDLGMFIIGHRGDKPSQFPLRPYETMVLETKGKVSDMRAWVEEVLKYRGEDKLLKMFQEWQVPKFPINGHMLLSRGVPGGRQLNQILVGLKQRWIESGFSLSENKLLELLEEVILELNRRSPRSEKKKLT